MGESTMGSPAGMDSSAGKGFRPSPGTWRVAALAGLFVLLFLPSIVRLASIVWAEEKYSHGYLIPLVSGFWLWLHRDAIAAVPRRPAITGLIPLGFGLAAALYGQARHFNSIVHASMIFVLVGMVAFAAGWRMVRATAFPILYLGFAFPVPQRLDEIYVVGQLQRVASVVSERIIGLAGIPVFRQGDRIEVPGVQLQVEEACSGLHSLYSLLALGAAFAFLTERRGWERFAILAAAAPIAVAANVVRVTVTGILAAEVSPDLARGFFHEFSGLVVFLLGLGLLLSFAWFLRVCFPVDKPAGDAVDA